MTQVFESMIQSLIDTGIGSVDHFFNEAEIIDLRKSLIESYESDEFRLAGIGNKYMLQKERSIRRDKVHWLNRDENDAVATMFFNRMDGFIDYLNSTCYAGIRSSEFHYAMYEPGAFYKRHSDQFNMDDRRQYSIVTYLTDNWYEGDGGELVLYTSDTHTISPVGGKTVIFLSSIEHEVLPARNHRLSITGWLKTRSIPV